MSGELGGTTGTTEERQTPFFDHILGRHVKIVQMLLNLNEGAYTLRARLLGVSEPSSGAEPEKAEVPRGISDALVYHLEEIETHIGHLQEQLNSLQRL